jgi:hypothetical protein
MIHFFPLVGKWKNGCNIKIGEYPWIIVVGNYKILKELIGILHKKIIVLVRDAT